MSFSPYYSINFDLSYSEHKTLDAAKLKTDHIILHIEFGSTIHQGHNNDNFIFNFYLKSGESIQIIEENGWKLSFNGPVVDRYYFRQNRMYLTVVAEPFDEGTGEVAENQQLINIENFINSYKRFKSIATPDRKSYVSVVWENSLLKDELRKLTGE